MSMRVLTRVVLFLVATAAVLFVSAGRIDLPFHWGFFGLVTLSYLVGLAIMDPGLREERVHPGPGGTDRRLRFFVLPIFTVALIVAGVDVGRFHWSHVPTWVQGVALAAVAAGYGLTTWAISANRFFSPVVRIQTDRCHELVTSGPYAWIRHPGYAGSLTVMLFTGPALGSWWALLPAGVVLVLFFRRVLVEDRFLHEHLDGYPAYARRVRRRLVPGVW